MALCKQRNKFVKGDKIELLSPKKFGEEFIADEIYDEEGNKIESCPHPGMICKIKIPFKVQKDTFLRKKL